MTTCGPVSQKAGTEFAEETNKEVVPASLGSSSSLGLGLSHASSINHTNNTIT